MKNNKKESPSAISHTKPTTSAKTAKTKSQTSAPSTTKKRANAKSSQVSALFTPSTAVLAPTSKPVEVAKKPLPANLPTRSVLFNTIQTHAVNYKKPLTAIQIAQELDVLPAQVGSLQILLDQMTAAGDIKMNPKGSYAPLSTEPLITGRIQTHKDGYGFLINDGEDVFIAERQMRGAWHGDMVTVRITGTARNGKREGEVVEVTERKFSQVVGRLLNENGVWLVSPDDVRLRTDILVAADDLAGALVNQIVVVALKAYGDEHAMPIGRVVEVLGNADDSGMEIEIAVRKFDVPHVFSERTEQQVAKLSDTVSPDEWVGRIDLRDVPLVTIDGEDARDFDDAVYCEPIKTGRKVTGYRLLVAIADVSHYVKDKTPLNEDALLRATSVYFPRRVVPMLPEKLSNGLCSLNPHVERLCMVADMVIDLDGQVTAYQFFEAVMHSAARLTYNQVWEFLDKGTGHIAENFAHLSPQIKSLYDLFKVLLQAREKRGAMEFETVETYMVPDENGKIKEIVPRTRNDAHRLIEECMLAANVCAAEFIETSDRLCLYRNHEGPTPEKLEALRKSLKIAGLHIGGGDKPTPKDYAAVMRQVIGRPDAAGLQTLLLRSMQQAVYAPDNLGHFGLAYSAYAHFTSPIRRYPDLLVHRTIKSILSGQRYTPMTEQIPLLEDTRKAKLWADDKLNELEKQKQKKDSTHPIWVKLGTHASMCERRADEASRDVTAWLKCEYMKQFIGETMVGTISSVTNFGAFVTLKDAYVDGLVHISELGQDYFEFDEVSYSLRGRASGVVYRLNDEVSVKIAGVDSDTRRVDFALVLPEGQQGKSRRHPSKTESATLRTTQAANNRTNSTKQNKRDARLKQSEERPAKSSRKRSKR
ncbi:ribonuclease R [Formosimonas limnophila]|uniref:ribonuclease R n=1 Tax=Formosimonas limnophila TaxID=1384487 RepID=UPI0016752361|nr:ribonuclease R [Formosimonas limnophila]